jgi:hypothetical protein
MKSLLFIICIFQLNYSLSAVIIRQETDLNGNKKLVTSKVQEIAKNCPNQVLKLIKKRGEILVKGNYEELSSIYSQKAQFKQEKTVLDKPKKITTFTTSRFIELLNETKDLVKDYLFLQLNGQCKSYEGYVEYSGMETEYFIVNNNIPIISTSILLFQIDKNTNKIFYSVEKLNMQLWGNNK